MPVYCVPVAYLQLTLYFPVSGLLNPLDCPHHMRIDDCEIPYREGVVLNRPAKPGKGSFVNVGLRKVSDPRVNPQILKQGQNWDL